jgi:Tfp pilus assembly protein PilF
MLPIAIYTSILLAVGGGFGCGCQQYNRPSSAHQQKFLSSLRAPTFDSVQTIRSAHYFKLMGRVDLALKELIEASERDPQNLKLLNALGGCYDDLGQYARAQEFYEKVLTIEPENISALNNLGYSLFLSGNHSAAESYFQAVLAKNPQNTLARNNLGLLYCRQGQSERALNLWQQAEGETQAKEKLSQVLAKIGCYPKMEPGTGEKSGQVVAQAPKPKPAAAVPQSAPMASQPSLNQKASKESAALQMPPAIKPKEETQKQESASCSSEMATPAETANKTVLAAKSGKSLTIKPKEETQQQESASCPSEMTIPAEKANKTVLAAKSGKSLTVKPKEETQQQESASCPSEMATPAETANKTVLAAKSGKSPTVGSKAPGIITGQTKADDPDWEDLGLEIRNGNGAPDIASLTRDLIKGNGLKIKAIANHLDFGAPETIIYYRPGFESVAEDIMKRFFKTGRLAQADNLKENIDVKVLLGHDLLRPNQVFAHLKSTYPIHEKSSEGSIAAAPGGSSTPVAQSRQAKVTDTASQADILNRPALAVPSVGNPIDPSANIDPPRSKFIEITPSPTKLPAAVVNLKNAAIEVRNGTWTENLARRIREMLKKKGLRTTAMGNHIDFGVQETIIYYRPGMEDQARQLNNLLFKAQRLEATDNLKPNIDIKVLLGSDLFQNNPNLSQLQSRKR